MGIQEKSHVYGYKLHNECVLVKNIFISSHEMMSCYKTPQLTITGESSPNPVEIPLTPLVLSPI